MTKCPLNRFDECIKDKCAWYQDDEHGCAVPALALQLGNIKDSIDEAGSAIHIGLDDLSRS